MIIKINRLQILACATVLFVGLAFVGVYAEEITLVEVHDGVPLPIVMYHQVTEKNSRAGRYAVTVAQLEKDFAYICERGYTAITVEELLSHVNGDTALPDKPIMITFDDGFESFYVHVVPLLKKYKLKAIVSVIGSVADFYSEIDDHNVSYSYLTWQEIAELVESEYTEVQNHSYDLHKSAGGRKGANKKRGESDAAYKDMLFGDLELLQQKMLEATGYMPSAFTYPFGACCTASVDILAEMGFEAAFVCEERINYISKKDPAALFDLGRYNRASGKSSEEFFKKLFE